MMRMLEAGGIPALTDGRRPPDQHNPHGYFEDERVRRLAEDSSWMAEARGKAVKIIYRLLRYLPAEFEYRVLFMQRNLEEVFDSQQDMLISRESAAAGQDRDRMIRALAADLEAARRANLRMLDVPYREVIRAPGLWAERVSQFLDDGLDVAAMAAVVDPGLYRHRKSTD